MPTRASAAARGQLPADKNERHSVSSSFTKGWGNHIRATPGEGEANITPIQVYGVAPECRAPFRQERGMPRTNHHSTSSPKVVARCSGLPHAATVGSSTYSYRRAGAQVEDAVCARSCTSAWDQRATGDVTSPPQPKRDTDEKVE